MEILLLDIPDRKLFGSMAYKSGISKTLDLSSKIRTSIFPIKYPKSNRSILCLPPTPTQGLNELRGF